MAATDWNPRELAQLPATGSTLTLAQHFQRFLQQPLVPLIGLLTLFMAALFNLVDLEAENETVGLSGQVLIKLALLGVGGLYGARGLISDINVRKALFSFPLAWIVIIFGFYCLAIPGSVTPLESMASTLSIACVVLLTVTALVQIGSVPVLRTLFHALSAFVILSWVAVFARPELGIFYEPIADGEFATRLGGLAHPNTLGQFSGLTIVLGLLLYSKFNQRSRWRIIIILLAGAALAGSLSRTSMLATMVAIVFLYRETIFHRKHAVYYLGLAIAGSMGLILMFGMTDMEQWIAGKLPFLSKSGDSEELFSATGRADIWSHAIHLIGEQPLTGYGAATSKYFLSDFSLYTHNLILHIAFSTGIIGGLAAVLMCLGRAVALFTQPHPIADALVAFVLINGLFENVIFAILAGLPTMIWTVALCLPLLGDACPEEAGALDGKATASGAIEFRSRTR